MTLDVLRGNRDALWWAELGAWLHNCGKLHEEFVRSDGGNEFRFPVGMLFYRGAFGTEQRMRDAANTYAAFLPQDFLKATRISLPAPFDDRVGSDYSYTIADIIEMQRLNAYALDGCLTKWIRGLSSRLTYVLALCHERASNIEKDQDGFLYLDPKNETDEKKKLRRSLTSVFGVPQETNAGSYRELWNEFGSTIEMRVKCFRDRKEFTKAVKRAFSPWGADGKWPINDVSLYDFSFAVAAFFKAAVARCLLEGEFREVGGDKKADTVYRWRVARIAVDGPNYCAQAVRVPDLLKRRELLDSLFDAVRGLMEDDLHLANEIYRDERGVSFLWPVLTGDESGEKLQALIEPELDRIVQSTEAGREMGYKLELGVPDPRGLGLGKVLTAKEPPAAPSLETFQRWWGPQASAVVCPVCHLRPIGAGPSDPAWQDEKAKGRKVCCTCEQRRSGRSIEWLGKLDHTIWIDEVADGSGRIALIAAKLGIAEWLEANGPIKSLYLNHLDTEGEPLINPKTAEPRRESKEESFARMYRVERTAREFWGDALCDAEVLVTSEGPRYRLSPPWADGGRGHSYYLQGRGLTLSVVKDSEGMVTAENLERLAKKAKIHDWMALKGQTFDVVEPTGYGKPNKFHDPYTATGVEQVNTSYPRLIRLSENPTTVLFAVPADQAFRVVESLRRRYEAEFGKVRNRLPLRIGVVFATSSVPLPSVLEAGRRMLEGNSEKERWKVAEPISEDSEYTTVRFDNLVTWNVPTGTGGTPVCRDVWYPYFRLAGEDVLPWMLQAGDQVEIRPSTFDFEFLQSAGERLEIAYDNKGRRRGPRAVLPICLEDVALMQESWRVLSAGNETTQLQQLYLLLRQKQEDWDIASGPLDRTDQGPEKDRTWGAFSSSLIHELAWKRGGRKVALSTEQEQTLETVINKGLLMETLELHLKILRAEPERAVNEHQEGARV